MASEREDGLRRRAKRTEDWQPVDKQTVTGMANSLRTEILVILSERPASVNGLSRDLGKDYDKVRYEFDRLKEVGLIEMDFERRVGGVIEVFYRAVKRPYIKGAEWPSVPDRLKGGMRGSLLDKITKDAIDSIEAGLYDSLEGAHMSRTPGLVDDDGWEEIRAWLLHSLEGVIEIFDNNRQRLAAANAIGTAVTVSMLGYPSTTPGRPTGPPPSDSEHNGPGSPKAKEAPKPKRKAKGTRKKA